MGKRKHRVGSKTQPIGPIIKENLARLGWGERTIVIRTTDIANAIRVRTGQSISTARVAAMLDQDTLELDTIAKVAESLGVSLSDLLSVPDGQ